VSGNRGRGGREGGREREGRGEEGEEGGREREGGERRRGDRRGEVGKNRDEGRKGRGMEKGRSKCHFVSHTRRTDQPEYRATRSAVVFPDISALTLDRLGPAVTLSVFLQNSRSSANGTAFPRSTLFINVPIEIVVDEEVRPLLVPLEVVVTGAVNCSQFQVLSELLVGVF
jgi:hypothetical protein